MADAGQRRWRMVRIASAFVWAFAWHGAAAGAQSAPKPKPTPEQRMAARFPQLVKISFLLGLPVLDAGASTVGHVRKVVRTADGKIKLVISHGGFLGIGSSLVAVPVEFLAMLGQHVAFVDGHYDEISKDLPATVPDSNDLKADETIRVAIIRR